MVLIKEQNLMHKIVTSYIIAKSMILIKILSIKNRRFVPRFLILKRLSVSTYIDT